jgi:hypothetical protein
VVTVLTPAQFGRILVEAVAMGVIWYALGYVVGDHQPRFAVGLLGMVWQMIVGMLRVTDLRTVRPHRRRES